MRRVLLLIYLVCCMAAVHAEDFAYLTIVETDGTKTSLTAVGLSIQFGENTLTATNAYTAEQKTVSLTQLASMNFSNNDETTGLENIQVGGDIDIHHADAVYTLQGQQLPSSRQLPKGIYIIRKCNVTQKLQVR